MLNHVVAVQVVLQVGVPRHGGVQRHQVLLLERRLVPGAVRVVAGVLRIVIGTRVAVLDLVRQQLRQQLGALGVLDARVPAKVIQAKVANVQVLAAADVRMGAAQDVGHVVLEADGHVADVDHAAVGAHAARGLGHDGRRVGVVEHPAVGAVLLHVLDVLQHARDGAHAVGHTAGAAGLLAHHAVLEGDLLVQRAHRQLAHANVRQAEVNVGVGRLGIRGGHELDRRVLLVHQDLTGGRQLALTVRVVVVQLDAAQRESVQVFQEHEDDLGGVGAAAARDHDGELLLFHVHTFFLSVCRIDNQCLRSVHMLPDALGGLGPRGPIWGRFCIERNVPKITGATWWRLRRPPAAPSP